MIKLYNDYHRTAYALRKGGELSPATVRRVRNALCGMSDCTCGGVLGERGPQDARIDERFYNGDQHPIITVQSWPPPA